VAKNLIVPTNYWRSLEFRLAFEELHASANDRILDVGSPKLLSLYLADRIGADVYSTDIEPYFIDDYTAFRKFLKVPENRFHAMVADGRTLPFDDGYFSRIFSVSVVEHIPDHGDSECLRELARTLSRGGICVLTVPFAPESRNEYKDKDSFYWSANVTAEEPSEGTFFQRRYSERDLHTRLIEPSGLEAVKIGVAAVSCHSFSIMAAPEAPARRHGCSEEDVMASPTNAVRRTSLLLLLTFPLLFCRGGVQDRALWITAYYPWWTYYTMNPSELDYSAMTHLVIFSANPVKEPPYLDVLTNPHDSANVVNGLDCGIPSNYLAQTIAKAHAKRVKVLLSVGGIYGPGAKNMSFIASDNARIATFVTGACAFARRQGFDGIELDWEHPYASDREGYVALILRFRRELDQWSPHGLFITAVNHTPWKNLGYDKDAMIAAFDQINPMTYEMHFGDYQHPRTGYNSPIERSTQFSDYGGYALNQPGIGPKAWEAFGIPASKLGLSISFTTTVFSDVVPPVRSLAGEGDGTIHPKCRGKLRGIP
jgi:hypothetical protein